MNKEEEWAEGDYLDWLDQFDEELASDPYYTTQAKKPAFNMPYDWDKEAKEAAEEKKRQKRLKKERMQQRVESAKRIKWKVIDKNYEYEVSVGGEVLGKVSKSNGKWVVQPEFNWNEDSYRNKDLAKSSYGDFRESGKALVDLWCLS